MKQPNEGQRKLYELLREKYDKGQAPTEEDIRRIYFDYAFRPWKQRYVSTPELTEERFNSNARHWAGNAIVKLVMCGWLGLVFQKNIVKRIIEPKPDTPEVGISLKGMEKELILKTLKETKGNKTKAGRMLGISRKTLAYKLKKYKDE